MAMTLQAAIDLTDTARERSLFYMVGFQKRHDPAMALCRQTLHRLLESSELGRLTLVRVWNHTGQDRERDGTLLMTSEARPDPPVIDPPAPAWLTPSRRASYDRFVNAYCHDINALHFFFDAEPNLRAADLDVMGGQAITLAYPDFIVSMAFTLSELSEWSMRGEWDEGMEFHFEGGRLLIAFPPPLYRNRNSRVTLRRGARSPEILSDGYSSDSTFTIQAKNLLRHLRAEIPSPSSASVCLRDMRLIDRMWRHTAGSEASDTAIQKVPCHG
jgi:predicted dehydrogenase